MLSFPSQVTVIFAQIYCCPSLPLFVISNVLGENSLLQEVSPGELAKLLLGDPAPTSVVPAAGW